MGCERWNAVLKISPSRSGFKHFFESVFFKLDSFMILIWSVKGKSTVFSAFYCLFVDVDFRAVDAINILRYVTALFILRIYYRQLSMALLFRLQIRLQMALLFRLQIRLQLLAHI